MQAKAAERAQQPASERSRHAVARTCRHMKLQEEARREEEALHMADPFDPEAQARIAERIQQAAVEESYQHALDHAPEIFTKVVMLYVNVEVRMAPSTGSHAARC